MGKYVNNKRKKKNNTTVKIVLLAVLVLLLILMIWIAQRFEWAMIPDLIQNGRETGASAESAESQQMIDIDVITEESIPLEEGLRIERIANYAGIYMEDGSDEVVSDVMMILLKNTGDQDLQLARIDIEYTDFTAEFEVTNLPAGETVVALEKNRHTATAEKHKTVSIRNMVFFQEPMSLLEEKFEISGGNGYLDVKNISGEDIAEEVYIYYKNSASDLLYGGITYRAPLRDGIAAGETVRMLTGHYSEGNSRIVLVTCG